MSKNAIPRIAERVAGITERLHSVGEGETGLGILTREGLHRCQSDKNKDCCNRWTYTVIGGASNGIRLAGDKGRLAHDHHRSNYTSLAPVHLLRSTPLTFIHHISRYRVGRREPHAAGPAKRV